MAVLIVGLPNPPLVNSISYGWPEAHSCESDITNANCTGISSEQYIARSEAELSKLAAMGISMITCSQDEGAPNEANMQCQLDNTKEPIWPIYPGSSAWVTSVSATTLIDFAAGVNTPAICQSYPCSSTGTLEAPCMSNNTYYDYTTGGGISNYTAMPSWQSAAVKKYFQSGVTFPPSYAYNPNNRAYPDVSAFGARVLVVMDGSVDVEEGTSASTPIVAGMVSLLNDWRLNNNKKQLGFLNPVLYQASSATPNAYKPVNFGNNRCTIRTCCKYGFVATNGYDSVSGLGTFNFNQILAYVKQV